MEIGFVNYLNTLGIDYLKYKRLQTDDIIKFRNDYLSSSSRSNSAVDNEPLKSRIINSSITVTKASQDIKQYPNAITDNEQAWNLLKNSDKFKKLTHLIKFRKLKRYVYVTLSLSLFSYIYKRCVCVYVSLSLSCFLIFFISLALYGILHIEYICIYIKDRMIIS